MEWKEYKNGQDTFEKEESSGPVTECTKNPSDCDWC